MKLHGRLVIGAAGLFAISMPLAGTSVHAAGPAYQYSAPASTSTGTTVPNATANNLDCNGWSDIYKPAVPALKMRCTDPIATFPQPLYPYAQGRFYDNGHYVGHDEPSVKFISSAANSANTMTYFQQLSSDPTTGTVTVDPAASPTVSHYGELSPAPWFGLPMCDSNSFPTLGGPSPVSRPCTPDSDSNWNATPTNQGGSAFMELQFYPPGFGPWIDAPSIDQNKWGVAITIDSFEALNSALGVISANPHCTEPVNIAFLTHDGVPMGPPNPQSFNVESQVETSDTLLMNPGDTTEVQIADTTHGLKTTVTDLTTGQSGFMIASATNGFMNTDPTTCNGSAYDFHAEYNTASAQNQVPWAALDGGVLMQQEIGHFEACSTLSNPNPQTDTFTNGDTFSDPNVQQTCNGPEQSTGTGEGPCTSGGATCVNGRSEGGVACNTATGPANCEQSDGFCMPNGARTVTTNATTMTTWTWPVAGCQMNEFQNGDLDYDGTPYRTDWPDGTATHPTSFAYVGPFDPAGNSYPNSQFQTDVGLEEANCNASTGAGCTAPPGSSPSNASPFYPFWSLTKTTGLPPQLTTAISGPCVWNFGNDIGASTLTDFSKDAQYGSGNGTQTKATLIAPAVSNPEFTGNSCPGLKLSDIVIGSPVSTPESPWGPTLLLVGAGAAIVAVVGTRRQRRRSAA